jgi:SAM-dependent methyltransferase
LTTRFHAGLVFARRTRVLARRIAALLPPGAAVLDVGCGDGTIDRLILDHRPDTSISGVDVLVRPATRIPVASFDGEHLPYGAGSFDCILFIDVLHHAANPEALLHEAKRVARQAILVKDHYRNGLLAGPTLRLMDWVGNAGHGVNLPYNYWSRAQWAGVCRSLAIEADQMCDELGLYPMPASLLFDRGLHFLARFPIASRPAGRTVECPGDERSAG